MSKLDNPPLLIFHPTTPACKIYSQDVALHAQQQLRLQGKMIKLCLWFATVMLFFSIEMTVGRAQNRDASCLNKIAPCMNYLDGTGEPPESCCDPLKSLIDSDPLCLCGLISNEGADRAEQAGINITAAHELPGRCGEHVNPLSCLTGSKNSASNLTGDAAFFSLRLAAVVSLLFQLFWCK